MKAPEFTLCDKDGKAVSLSDFLGKKVVLYFYPKDNTPGCSKQACVYNYSYVWLPDGGGSAESESAEGNFYDTDNEYLILIYHREFASRYDKLIGVGRVDYKLHNN